MKRRHPQETHLSDCMPRGERRSSLEVLRDDEANWRCGRLDLKLFLGMDDITKRKSQKHSKADDQE